MSRSSHTRSIYAIKDQTSFTMAAEDQKVKDMDTFASSIKQQLRQELDRIKAEGPLLHPPDDPIVPTTPQVWPPAEAQP